MFLTFVAGYAFGDSGCFTIANIETLSGGNKNLVDFRKSPYMEANNGQDYAYNVQKLYNGRYISGVATIQISENEKGTFTSKPVAKNSVPKEKNALLNAKNPIVIVSNREKITIGGINEKENEIDLVRIFDSKGKLLGETKNYDDFTVKLSEAPQNYYIEARIYPQKYCYVLVRMSFNPEIKLTKDEINFAKSIINGYMQRNNIKSYEDFSDIQDSELALLFERIKSLHDMEANLSKSGVKYITLEQSLKERNMTYYDLSDDEKYEEVSKSLTAGHMNAMTDALKKRGKSIDDDEIYLSEDDVKAIGKEVYGVDMGGGESGQKYLEDYMRRHGINGYDELTEKDMEDFEKEMKQQMMQQYSGSDKSKSVQKSSQKSSTSSKSSSKTKNKKKTSKSSSENVKKQKNDGAEILRQGLGIIF